MAGVTLGILGSYCGLYSGITAGMATITGHGCTIDNPSLIDVLGLHVAVVTGNAVGISLHGKDVCSIVSSSSVLGCMQGMTSFTTIGDFGANS